MFEVHIFLLNEGSSFLTLMFENDVNMYGTQTKTYEIRGENMFENDVNMYGTQTMKIKIGRKKKFENDVNMYGTQTPSCQYVNVTSLRMM